MSVILPSLFLGDYNDALSVLKGLTNVTAVLTVAKELPLHLLYPGAQHRVNYKYIPLEDSPQQDLLLNLQSAFAFIDSAMDAGQKVLVHCAAGVSRSASIVIAYLMLKHNITFQQAFTHVQKRRPIINPNPGFMRQLSAL